MLASIGTFIANFFLNKIWNLLVLAVYWVLAFFMRKEKLAKNEKKLENAIQEGDKDKIAKAGEDALNNN